MEKRRVPSLKRYLARMAMSLKSLRDASIEQWDEELSAFEEMVVVLEDRRYFRHRGLDWQSVLREIIKVVTLRRHGGASTIEMQYVRTVTGRYERDVFRKIDEILLSMLLAYHLDKLTILRTYLAYAYFGTGIAGAEEAAQRLYGKDTHHLSVEECAVVASLLVYPMPRQPSAAWRAKVQRRAAYGVALWRRLHQRLK